MVAGSGALTRSPARVASPTAAAWAALSAALATRSAGTGGSATATDFVVLGATAVVFASAEVTVFSPDSDFVSVLISVLVSDFVSVLAPESHAHASKTTQRIVRVTGSPFGEVKGRHGDTLFRRSLVIFLDLRQQRLRGWFRAIY